MKCKIHLWGINEHNTWLHMLLYKIITDYIHYKIYTINCDTWTFKLQTINIVHFTTFIWDSQFLWKFCNYLSHNIRHVLPDKSLHVIKRLRPEWFVAAIGMSGYETHTDLSPVDIVRCIDSRVKRTVTAVDWQPFSGIMCGNPLQCAA